MDNTGKVILGALAGLAAGAVLGILLAPDKGSETRRKIVEKGNNCADDVKDKIEDIIDGLHKQVDVVKAKVKEAEVKIQKKVKEVEDSANKIVEA